MFPLLDASMVIDLILTLAISVYSIYFPFLHSLKIIEPRPIVFKEWRDTRTFSNLKSTHCTLLILLMINLVDSLKTMGLGSIIFKEWRVTWTFS
jgi:lipopolysaccharide/colanic/teichoic acid biosynthesis glycosyltransferase